MQNDNFNSSVKVCVVGGGAAGMMAAGTACLYGASVTIFESMKFLGKKLAITGKGRCNVTNNSEIHEFLENVPKNPRFLYTALNTLSPKDTMTHFESLGVSLKTERGRRVFPLDDKAKTIVDAMKNYSSGADVIYEKVKKIEKLDSGFKVVTAEGEYLFDKVILATGGKSYPLTGSDGSGYRLATRLGHSVTALTPSLIPLESCDEICKELQGLSLKNVGIKLTDDNGKLLYSDFGEMMFTHFGVTGPVILSASSHLVGKDISTVTLSVDLKPALDEATLDKRLLSDFSKNLNKHFVNSLSDLLPSKLIEPFVKLVNIEPHKRVNEITKEERKRILDNLKGLKISLSGTRPIEEAIITSGGIEVKEISPKNMESKLVSGLYFAGEIIDVDAYTGGYNLQIAFSTGYLAGLNSAIN